MMDDCPLGCEPEGSIGACPRACPCDCHRPVGLAVERHSVSTNTPAPLPRPGEVIPRPYDDLAIEKVAEPERRDIVDAMKAPASVDMPDPFDDPDLPDDLRRKHL